MWGKLIGFLLGFALTKHLVGGLLGLYLGHIFDKSIRANFEQAGGFNRLFSQKDKSERQALFFYSSFSVMGHIAKSNGRVSEAHIRAASLFMDEMRLDSEQKREAQQAFRSGKESDFPLKDTLSRFKQHFSGRFDLIQLFLEIQIQMAFSDGHLAENEVKLLQQVAKLLGISPTHFKFVLKRYQAEFAFRQYQQQSSKRNQSSSGSGASKDSSASKGGKSQALEVLGLEKDADQKAIKKAYRKLMAQHHPDKLVSQGLPEHMMELAKRKSQDIQAAYEYLKKAG